MLVTPAPVGLLIADSESGEIRIFTVALLHPHTVRLIFVTIPLMIVVVSFVVVNDLVFLGSQRGWLDCDGDEKSGGQQGRVQETGHDFSPIPKRAIDVPSVRRRLWRTQRS